MLVQLNVSQVNITQTKTQKYIERSSLYVHEIENLYLGKRLLKKSIGPQVNTKNG